MKLEHIGIAIQSLEQSNDLFSKLLGHTPYKEELVESEHVLTSFFSVGNTKIELLEATNEKSAIAKYLTKNREGVHHLAFGVENLEYEINRLKKEGFEFINETPKEGADNKLVVFLHPKTTNGVLVELCMDKK
ncbi:MULTISPECIES: methylmalonyl-CoA epimerase [Weeksella]|uniref:Methylmalonyl-CoA epimerase n=1 Tax=Weeksella virosa (strain ATCC 43766 / DSM 16922 / JCM 21250 / CCUG 30538 / CDC 9751 / IAM 14551 / NBRC 16016 / NCTC 11634 / CL345/78) TaxID=865938 RepID=F0P2F3_WEEVC|nr:MULTISPECIES: methylmalonyl-CoA epimerase [Weeksella]ADX66765.1 methylmalonyl-CoA epimerase [Weeksella virosa DSM 16922]MDK7675144.1 methylmalonyl-CoA epimerase [Weeksella virosa]OFM85445.1 methylmalonyl-CoA epimerase [Weeksella sp. HMSC059D05]SUP53042.1 4-hydroxyphenylpyruvate dioxygenase and related hemolysins [Weeksella virosa]VEH63512.1 4-hydroxyphenylpyruvate dioxygenase and related hemolysins [Weeksella virosa]